MKKMTYSMFASMTFSQYLMAAAVLTPVTKVNQVSLVEEEKGRCRIRSELDNSSTSGLDSWRAFLGLDFLSGFGMFLNT